MPRIRRKTISRHELQIALARRVLFYWGASWLLVFALPAVVRLAMGQMPFDQIIGNFFGEFWFPMAISVFLVPVIIRDSLRFGNRIAGPVYRINRTVTRMADGSPVRPVELRGNDYCNDLAFSLNRLIENRENNSLEARQGEECLVEAMAG